MIQLDAKRQAKLTLGLTADLETIADAVTEYRETLRSMRPKPLVYRRYVEGQGTRYLALLNNRATFRSGDLLEMIQYKADHPDSKIIDMHGLNPRQRYLIGQYLAVRESTIQQEPKARVLNIAKVATHPDGVSRQHPETHYEVLKLKLLEGHTEPPRHAFSSPRPLRPPKTQDIKGIDVTPRGIKLRNLINGRTGKYPCGGCGQMVCRCKWNQALKAAMERQSQSVPNSEPCHFSQPEPRFYRVSNPALPISQANAVPVF